MFERRWLWISYAQALVLLATTITVESREVNFTILQVSSSSTAITTVVGEAIV
jgi:hypothetical protein